uniref:Uncharacterized protein n=1 Tax=Setaria italica TaxID=4555 RepID=K3Y3Y6_SETIT
MLLRFDIDELICQQINLFFFLINNRFILFFSNKSYFAYSYIAIFYVLCSLFVYLATTHH